MPRIDSDDDEPTTVKSYVSSRKISHTHTHRLPKQRHVPTSLADQNNLFKPKDIPKNTQRFINNGPPRNADQLQRHELRANAMSSNLSKQPSVPPAAYRSPPNYTVQQTHCGPRIQHQRPSPLNVSRTSTDTNSTPTTPSMTSPNTKRSSNAHADELPNKHQKLLQQDSVEKQLKENEETINILCRQKTDLEVSNDVLKKELETVKKQLDESNATIQQHGKQLEEKDKQCNAIVEDIKLHYRLQAKSLTDTFKSQMDKLKQILNDEKQKTSKLSDDLAASEKSRLDLESKLAEMTKTNSADENVLKQEIANLKKENTSLEIKIKDAGELNDKQKAELVLVEGQLKAQKERNLKQEGELALMRGTSLEINQKFEETSLEIQTLTETNARLEKELGQKKTELAERNQAFERLSIKKEAETAQRMTMLESEHSASRTKIQELEHTIQSLKAELQKLQTDKDNALKEFKVNASMEKSELAKENRVLKDAAAKLKAEMERLEASFDVERKQLLKNIEERDEESEQYSSMMLQSNAASLEWAEKYHELCKQIVNGTSTSTPQEQTPGPSNV